MKHTLTALALLAWLSPAHAILACSSSDDGLDDLDVPPAIETVTWYVGQPAPSLDVGYEQYVTCVATGPELAYIRAGFTNLPMRGNSNSRMVFWHGDNARFILDNL